MSKLQIYVALSFLLVSLHIHANENLASNYALSNVGQTNSSLTDSDIPYIPLIYIDGPNNGNIKVTGFFSSVFPNDLVHLSNDQSSFSTTVTADEYGSFEGSLTGKTGETISIQSRNSLGIMSDAKKIKIMDAINISIDNLGNNALIASDSVIVRGTTDGPINTGVLVNGMQAFIEGEPGRYEFTALVYLEPGKNTIIASAMNLNNMMGQTSTVVESTSYPPFKIDLKPNHGVVPLNIKTKLFTRGKTKITKIEYDFDGDGSIDSINFNYSTPEHYTFEEKGIHIPKFTVTTNSGDIYSKSLPIYVEDANFTDIIIQSIWGDMTKSLAKGDIDNALQYFTRNSRKQYKDLFYALRPHNEKIVASFSDLYDGHYIGGDIASYNLDRIKDGETRTYPVYFIRDVLGIWRIESM